MFDEKEKNVSYDENEKNVSYDEKKKTLRRKKMSPTTRKKKCLHDENEKGKQIAEEVLANKQERRNLIAKRLERILTTSTHQILNIVPYSCSVKVYLNNIFEQGCTYEFQDNTCVLNECFDEEKDTLEKLKHLCFEVKIEQEEDSSEEEEENDDEKILRHHNMFNIYLPMKNGNRLVAF